MLNNLKDLEKAIKLCRRLGVESIRIGEVEFHLGTSPEATKPRAVSVPTLETPPGEVGESTSIDINIPTDGLTDEQLLFYSSGPDLPGEATN